MVSQTTQNLKLFSTEPKPAHPTFEVWLDTLLNSNLSEILGHESTLKYLSIQGPKSGAKGWARLAFIHLFWERKCFTRVQEPAGCHLLIVMQLALLALLADLFV